MVGSNARTGILALVAAVLGVLLVYILNQQPTPGEVAYHVRSTDKRVEIRIPEQALPEDFDVLDIAWRRDSVDTYTLLPEDLELTGVVSISFGVPMLPSGTVTLPRILLTTDDGEVEPVDIRVRHYRDQATAVIEVDTEQFRQIQINQ